MLDKVFAAIGMLAVIAFMGLVTVYVMEPDLWVVTMIVVGIGIVYFVREVKAGGSRVEGKDNDGSGP